jgi:hypothetical protein
VNATSS